MADLLEEIARGGATVLFSSHQLDLVEDLCQDVVIVDHGHVVLSGALAELRSAVPQRFVGIRHHGPAVDWSPVVGVQVVEAGDGHTRLRVDRDIDLPQVIAAAKATGHLVSFAFQPPTLSELFHEAVRA
jgi:ABC-2 type transport system ATP-binding protein